MSQLEFRQIAKQFPGVRALDGVSLCLRPGRVHALMGENGAGKSTLLKILSGDLQADGGELLLDGQPQRYHSAADALAAGVAVIHQELQYVPEMTVFENLLLGRLPQRFGFVRSATAVREIAARLQAMGVPMDLAARLKDLSTGQRQMVEICKALLRDARVIALDEPTSSLSHREAEQLFRLVRELRAAGKALVYVSHRMDEIFALCDSATVLRDGRSVAEFDSLQGIGRDALVQAMVGREISDVYGWAPRPQGAVRLQVSGLHSARMKSPASFEARHGEILGFFGLVGAGRSELLRAVYGADTRLQGQVLLDGQPLAGEVGRSIAAGLMFCSEDRKEDGIVGCRSVAENINISSRRHSARWGFVDEAAEAEMAERFIKRLRIRCSGPEQEIQRLSGGNQQKALLARWLSEQALRVLIIDEPTRGIDIGAKREIYEVLHGLADQGVTVIIISSELPEVLGLADRIVVMREGEIVGTLAREQASEAAVLQLAFPAGEAPPAAQPLPMSTVELAAA
ncbi:L-arabinose ABC transporter ATP-binding protein AraG [Paucibacter sp. APW11]|uniref:L-arabinose ABC transporter ATP-binding protein AraG n=2 Tax=Roseateles aquae TaxID=3077235 RepID=A0ABU3P936_9BURK|nr:L-arabinose ABC transporter ATP-binding protein AraG [Paucibacter sp. APW11]MDT8999081.1 L-arabinose ABC transporter ATP-binding protein AraG [Paucibacter sp. APW11]